MVADRHVHVGVLGAADVRAGADAARAGPRRHVALAFQERDGLHAEGLAHGLQEGLQAVLAAQHAAREVREDLRLGAQPRGLMGPAGGEVHDGGDRDRHGHEDDDRDDVLRVGDRPLVQRRGEVVVEEQRAERRRRERRYQAAKQGRRHGQREEQQHVVRETEVHVDVREKQREQRGTGDADQPAPDDPGAAESRAARHRQAPPLGDLTVRDDVDVEVGPRLAGDGRADAGSEDVLPGLAARGAEDDLGGVDAPREFEQGPRDVVAYDVMERSAQVLHEGALDGQLLGRGGGEAVAAGDVDGEDLAAGALGGHAGGAADEGAALGSAGEADDDALTGLPGGADVVLAAVLLEVFVDPVGYPQQRQLAQGRQVPGAEVVGQGRVDLVRLVDVAVRHPAAQRLRRHVDQLDLVGPAHHLVRDRLALADAGDRFDDVAERLQVLDVDGGYHVDARFEELLDVLPALGVARAGHVGVRQFVDERDGGGAAQDGVHVHLREQRAAVLQLLAGDLLQTVQHHFRAGTVVVLHEGHDAVGAALDTTVCLGERGVRLADARCRTEVDPKLAACHGPIVFLKLLCTQRRPYGQHSRQNG
ncbi:putative Sensor protein KdpD [Streptomyces aurantiacus JA 4570]|uniref:Putative Sensor protein KdpD n=1 Tax=Streptomyces aurantiacus JA 4570 TaxID=1286094 RepID=S4AX23_9ACTN|nr:putative Sensor protein KdpD [Streptomyces aurantiacus JA 4570]